MKALVIVIPKWAHTVPGFARLDFGDRTKSGGTRAKKGEYIEIHMDNCQKKKMKKR